MRGYSRTGCILAEASRKEDGRRGPELVCYGAPWSLEGASHTLDLRAVSQPSLFTHCCSDFWRRERTLDLVVCVCGGGHVPEPIPQPARPKAIHEPIEGAPAL